MAFEKEPLDGILREVALLIRLFEQLRTALSQNGILDRAAYLLLARLVENSALRIGSIADMFHLDISTVSRQIAGLESKGLLERVPDPHDGRVSRVAITEAGRQRLEEYRAAYHEMFEEILAKWPESERVAFSASLARLNRGIVDQLMGGAAE